MSTMSSSARSALRRLVRAKNNAFRGDPAMLQAASKTIREEFNRRADATDDQMPGLLKEIDDAVQFLRSNIVQAPLNERGNYVVDAKAIDEGRSK